MEQMKQQNKKPVVVGIGELLWDLLPTGKTAGGAPINFVYHASRLGAEGYAISAIGDDDNGRDILSELNKYKIQYLIEKLPYPTGTVHVDIEDDGIPHYTITERVAWDHMSPTSDAVDLAERADAICFGALGQRCQQSRETILSYSQSGCSGYGRSRRCFFGSLGDVVIERADIERSPRMCCKDIGFCLFP